MQMCRGKKLREPRTKQQVPTRGKSISRPQKNAYLKFTP